MVTKHSFSILIWILRYRLKNGKVPLSIRITVNGERAEIFANRDVLPALWDPKAQRVKGNSEEAKSINAHLETIPRINDVTENQLLIYFIQIHILCSFKNTFKVTKLLQEN